MIYVEEKGFDQQIELLLFVANSKNLNVCAWLYPESNATKTAGFKVTDNPYSLIPVTTYENGFSPKCTTLVSASSMNIRSFSDASTELKKNCDSLALYKTNEPSWLAAIVGHEGMCLVQDETLLNSLTQSGFAVTTTVPSWW